MDKKKALEKAGELLRGVVLDTIKSYWHWVVVVALVLFMGIGWSWSSGRYRTALHQANKALKFQTAETEHFKIERDKATKQLALEKEKKKDDASAARIDQLQKEVDVLEKKRKAILKKRNKAKKDLKGKSIEDIDRIIKGELE